MQLIFPIIDSSLPIADAVSYFGDAKKNQRGGVNTKREVAEFILDLIGYTADKDLYSFRILEPSCGAGDFLVPVVNRLLYSAIKRKRDLTSLSMCVSAFDVAKEAIEDANDALLTVFKNYKVSQNVAESLIASWVNHADFLMSEHDGQYTHVVGNPPYLRQEALPKELLNLYRNKFSAMYDRADLYVPFIQKSLELLKDSGRLCFICADRWMKNRYGGPLRKIVSENYHLEIHVDMTDCPAFEKEVVAYPAITVIRKGHGEQTHACYKPEITSEVLASLVAPLRGESRDNRVHSTKHVVNGSEPWILDSFDRLNVIRKIESHYPVIEDTGCRIGIGVATGADSIYIGSESALDVEEKARIPLVKTKDLKDGKISWGKDYVLNPYSKKGGLLNLDHYPKLKKYLLAHEAKIRSRNVAKKNPINWYKTIDRIYPELQFEKKLLIPDIKGRAEVVYDDGKYYPHHNLYYIVSNDWDLLALQAIMLSRIAQSFVATYSLKMRGDCLRYQAQYLRRIRVPMWDDVSKSLRKQLRDAAILQDVDACDRATRCLYNLSDGEWDLLA